MAQMQGEYQSSKFNTVVNLLLLLFNQFLQDMIHLYGIIGLAPWVIALVYTGIFIGPATLTPVPEGYVPEEYEYHRVRSCLVYA